MSKAKYKYLYNKKSPDFIYRFNEKNSKIEFLGQIFWASTIDLRPDIIVDDELFEPLTVEHLDQYKRKYQYRNTLPEFMEIVKEQFYNDLLSTDLTND